MQGEDLSREPSLLIFAGWLIDGTGTPAESCVIAEVQAGHFSSIQPAANLDSLKAANRPFLDLSHCTVLPVLSDCHVHLAWSGTTDRSQRDLQFHQPRGPAGAAISGNLERHLAHGILAVRDGGDSGNHALRFKQTRPRNPYVPVCIRAAGTVWHKPGRYGSILGPALPAGKTLADCLRSASPGADHVKIVNSGLNSLAVFGRQTPPQFEYVELRDAVNTAARAGMPVMVHANGVRAVREAIEAGCRSIEHGYFMGRENLEYLAERRVYWVPTAYSMKAYVRGLDAGTIEQETARRNYDHQVEQLAHARAMGVPIALGTDAGGFGIHHGSSCIEELRVLVEAGFPVEEALACAASRSARLLGLQNEIGRIIRGMPASFVVVRGGISSLPGSLESPAMIFVRGERVPLTRYVTPGSAFHR